MSIARHSHNVAVELDNMRRLIERYVLGSEVITIPPVIVPSPPPSYSAYTFPITRPKLYPYWPYQALGDEYGNKINYGAEGGVGDISCNVVKFSIFRFSTVLKYLTLVSAHRLSSRCHQRRVWLLCQRHLLYRGRGP